MSRGAAYSCECRASIGDENRSYGGCHFLCFFLSEGLLVMTRSSLFNQFELIKQSFLLEVSVLCN